MWPDWTKELSRWTWVIVLLFTSHLCSSTSLLSSSNFRKYKTGKYISWLKLCAGVQCADLRHVWMECRRRWSAFLSKHSRSRKPRAIWQGLASVDIWFESTVSFLPHTLLFFPFSAPFTHSNVQFHPQIELLSWQVFFFDWTDVSACHFFLLPCNTGERDSCLIFRGHFHILQLFLNFKWQCLGASNCNCSKDKATCQTEVMDVPTRTRFCCISSSSGSTWK